MLNQLIQFVALFLLMLVTGVFFGPWLSLHRSMKIFKADVFIQLVKTLAANLAGPMRIMMPVCIILMSTTVYLHSQIHSTGFYLDITALLFIIISLVVTVTIEVPIVKQLQNWNEETIPAKWEELRNRWLKFHLVRTIAALLSFACFTAEILFF